MEGRLQHWRDGLSLLHGPEDWLFGKGLGRFPASYFFAAPDSEFPGTYRLTNEDSNSFLTLSGPRYPLGFGDLFRVSQRVALSPGMYSVLLDARAKEDVDLHLEVCEKHLLYSAGCAIKNVRIKGLGREWQHFEVALDGRALSGGPWYAPRLAFFSLAIDSRGRQADIDNIGLVGPDGQRLLVNGDFSAGMARWFFTSDRRHLPWHIKDMALDVLFDQGVIGLLAFTALLMGALWRLTGGSVREHPLAPYLAAALLGFTVVGVFDSLLDAPRVAFLFYLLCLVALLLPKAAR
jgi:hypothetical protein